MKSVATKTLGMCAVVISLLVSTSFADEDCRCPAKPNGPGGGVKCAKGQMATCDPSSGECNCYCTSVQQGASKAEYISLILSQWQQATVEPSELQILSLVPGGQGKAKGKGPRAVLQVTDRSARTFRVTGGVNGDRWTFRKESLSSNGSGPRF